MRGAWESLTGVHLGLARTPLLVEKEVSVAAACWGKGVEKPLGTLPSDGWGIWNLLSLGKAGTLLPGAGTWGRDQRRVAACVSWWQVGTVRVAWALELGSPLAPVYLACFCYREDPPEQTACSSLATCVALCETSWDCAGMDGLQDW